MTSDSLSRIRSNTKKEEEEKAFSCSTFLKENPKRKKEEKLHLKSSVMDEDLISCQFCGELFRNPVILHCGHSVCSSPCLERLSSFSTIQKSSLKKTSSTPQQYEVEDNNTVKKIPCPTCSQVTTLSKGIEELKPNYELRDIVNHFQGF